MDLNKFGFCIHFLLLAFSLISASPVQLNDLTKGLSEFARDFYSQCVTIKPGNVIVSPLSVSNALALLSQGSSGKTLEELENGLHLSSDKLIVANQFLEQRETLRKNVGNATLSIANQIFIQQGRNLNENFQDVAVSKFESGIESLNFAESEKSAQAINQFVEKKTNGKIQDLIKPNQFTPDTRTVLVNAIYFKGAWEHQFEKEKTHKGDFYISETEKVPVDFMFSNDIFNFAYLEELESMALEMKYANSNLSFVIVLPFSRTGLTSVESKLKNYDLTKIIENMYEEIIDVYIPKFKVEYEIDLKNVMQNLGMSEMFSSSADLEGLLESGDSLQVSEFVHKATIEIDEKGSEATAGTAVSLRTLSGPPSFMVDHPFMYFIRESETNTIIFSGRIEKF